MRTHHFCLVFGLLLSFSLSTCAQDFGKINIGPSIGGSGLVGVSLQIRPVQMLVGDAGIYGRIAHVDVFEPRWILGPSVDAGLSCFIRQKNLEKKNKLILDGFYLKGAKGLGELDEVMAGLGWIREISKSESSNFMQVQIGPSIIQRTETYINTRYPPGEQEQIETWITGMIYARLVWYLKLKK